MALLGVLLVPLFVATWRTSLLGLCCQGFLMAWIAYRLDSGPRSPGDLLTLADLALVRGVAAPIALYTVLRAQDAPKRNDVIPPNLLSWTLAFGIVLVAFNFSESLVPAPGEQRTLVAVATSGLMLGALVLSTQGGPFSQMVGALRIENAIALFELGGPHHHEAIGVQLGQVAIVAITIVYFRRYLKGLSSRAIDDSPPDSAMEPPTL
jgi:hydrogenase-4 membrane subunit HyfE